jgi:asparagine synthase (glutamine-hydrolysing)
VDNEKTVWNSELPQLEWDARAELKRLAHQIGCRVGLDGYYGDQMLANPGYLVDFARNFRWLELRRDFAEWSRWMAESDPATVKRELRWILSRGLVPYKLVRIFRRYRGITESRQPAWYARPFRERAFRRYVVSRRVPQRFASHYAKTCYEFVTARTRMNNVETDNKNSAVQGLEIAYPFMDRDLIEFLVAIPGHVVNWKGVPKGLFREAMKGVLPEAIRLRNWKSDFTALNNDAATSNLAKFQTYFGPGCSAVTNGYIDPIGAQFEFSSWEFDPNSILPAVKVTAAVAFELFLRLFWAGNEFSSHTSINL